MIGIEIVNMRLLKLLKEFYWRYMMSPNKYAQHIGVKVGKNCLISTRYWSSEPYLIEIGSNCQITNGVRFHTHGGGNVVRQMCPDFDVFGKITVNDWAYIGNCSQIMPGVTIGEGALVAAGSVVTKSVAPYTVVGGNPAKYICTTMEYYEKNKKYNVRTKGMSASEKKRILIGLSEEHFIKK